MKETWYFITTPPTVDRLKPGNVLANSSGYPTWRKARMALIESLQADARVYKSWAERKLQQVVEAAHMEEPS